MIQSGSSCGVGQTSTTAVGGSRVLRFQPDFRWEGVPVLDYKAPANHWCGIQRTLLVGEHGETTQFHVRYFEIAPGGFSSLEHHGHEHVVFVLRGRGEVRLGDARHELGFGDVVYVGPHEVHQFRNAAEAEPFGFLCMVDAERDTPVPHQD
jgi:quercetin dioxygenase-like cupin family protein